MNIHTTPQTRTGISVCPHDCPSTCALEVDLLDEHTIGRVRGAKAHNYTQGVICEKVARYAERIHHPDRLLFPLKRTGKKGEGQFTRISWDAALDEIGERFNAIEAEYGAEAIWPYWYAGTMGLVMRDGIERLRHVKGYSGMYGTFCVALGFAGYFAGHGRVTGIDAQEMQASDLIVVWGGNPVNTQVNVMHHIGLARKARGTQMACVDIYDTGTMKQADHKFIIRPGTDGALACALAHVMFRDGLADRAYLQRYADDAAGFEAHLKGKTPEWAAAITGLSAARIEDFARLLGRTQRTFFRIGYGFTRTRVGAFNMHAVTCLPVVAGHWQHKGGGALFSGSGAYGWNKSFLMGTDRMKPGRTLDQCRLGDVLLGNAQDLCGGPPVKAMFIQNTNPASVAPDQSKVKQGFERDDLFTVVHEQFMTDTARYADIVLPATMFLEHDDVYTASGHQSINFGRKLVEPPGECRSNHDVLREIAQRVGAEHPGFAMTPRALIDQLLQSSQRPGLDALDRENWFYTQPDFETSHFLKGFGHADGKFRFKPDWQDAGASRSPMGVLGDWADMPSFPDFWDARETETEDTPFRLATSPARTYLNSSFTETPGSQKREAQPTLLVHSDDLAACGIAHGDKVAIGNGRGTVFLMAKAHDGQQPGTLIAEGIWPNSAHANGCGINTLIGSDQPAPAGGGVFHDATVWLKKA